MMTKSIRALSVTRNLHLNQGVLQTSSAADYDTIYALSSGPMVKSGVAVVRLSGPNAYYCSERLITPLNNKVSSIKPLLPRQATLRKLYCPKSGDMLDQALLLWFPGPNSFTGEDVIEFHLHGSRAVILGVFSALEQINNELTSANKGSIRPSERGEFTRRAFHNGKMDLTAVEGLSDLLEADTAEQRKQALKQMDGHLLEAYERWRSELLRGLAHTEAVIDFGDDDREDDVNDNAMWALIPKIKTLRSDLIHHLKDGRRGEILREGVRIALVGPPNAGKSSLINALAKRPVAIVSPIAGTTRDVVEVRVDLGGISCLVCDTAGLRGHSEDPIEVEGMKRARDAFRKAQLKIFVCDVQDIIDNGRDDSKLQLLQEIQNESKSLEIAVSSRDGENDFDENSMLSSLVIVLNKVDTLSSTDNLAKLLKESAVLESESISNEHYSISCTTGQGLEELERGIENLVKKMMEREDVDGVLITRERHRHHLKQAVFHLDKFLEMNVPMDLAAEELRLAMMELGKVTGKVDVEEILDIIFRDFCIGK